MKDCFQCVHPLDQMQSYSLEKEYIDRVRTIPPHCDLSLQLLLTGLGSNLENQN